jgi:hypothetical protein
MERSARGGFHSGRPALPPAAALDLRERDELFAMWSAARAEANLAYDDWRSDPGRETYFAYRAAEERADAAQDALAEACSRYPSQDAFRLAA